MMMMMMMVVMMTMTTTMMMMMMMTMVTTAVGLVKVIKMMEMISNRANPRAGVLQVTFDDFSKPNWMQRYCMIKSKQLEVYKSHGSERPELVIPLPGMCLTLIPNTDFFVLCLNQPSQKMYVKVGGWMVGWMDGDGWVDGWLYGWMVGWVDGWVDGWMVMVGWIDGLLGGCKSK